MVKRKIKSLLYPEDCTMIFIDHQPQMAFGVASIDRQLLLNNVIALAKAAKIFNVPTILTTVETESFSGYMWPQILDIFNGQKPIERSSMNSWGIKNSLPKSSASVASALSCVPCGRKSASVSPC